MNTKVDLDLKDADISYYPSFFSTAEANRLFRSLLKNTDWIQDDITLFGKTYKQPRLTAFHARNLKSYSYSNITMIPRPFTSDLEFISDCLKRVCEIDFSSCLLNLYRNGQDSNGWHADNEKELGKNPVIASVSLGAERQFNLKHRHIKELRHKIILEHGSLLLMKGSTQHYWLHQIPKTKKEVGQRINLTFRVIK
ncbi:MAG: alpha-ketoglutarate-dependent dioxygenase AlkB [Flavobacteriaceae bacterium]|nr:alpha-ketoglutarate-dependent dioxygenase AlkB [Bacteroidia bacterium]NNF75246.1 alpha-ketoglutarate-dependent dioxygenase AlkB [Flavobacteriaceae bacterium]NNK74209.1 alpha-ketoglutarate-dependent dioxygenase AlkB [Flavobacteriaceae bacterium]